MKTHNEVEKGIEDAEKDAKKDSKLLFLLIGFFLPLIGILISIIYKPKPNTSRFIDRTAEYIQAYLNEYTRLKRKDNMQYAILGTACIILLSLISHILDL